MPSGGYSSAFSVVCAQELALLCVCVCVCVCWGGHARGTRTHACVRVYQCLQEDNGYVHMFTNAYKKTMGACVYVFTSACRNFRTWPLKLPTLLN